MISTRSVGLLIDTVVCLTLAKWETVSGRFGGYLSDELGAAKLGVVIARMAATARTIPKTYASLASSGFGGMCLLLAPDRCAMSDFGGAKPKDV